MSRRWQATAVSSARKAWAAIEKQNVHEPELAQDAVQAAQEQLGRLVGADHDAEPEPGGVVEEEHSDAPLAPDAGAEVLTVGEHHHHAVRVGEPSPVGLLLGRHAAQRQAEANARAPDRGPIDALVRADHAELEGAPDQLGDGRVAILGLLRREEVEQRVGQCTRDHGRGRDRRGACRLVAVRFREPSVDGADRDGRRLTGECPVVCAAIARTAASIPCPESARACTAETIS
jgi:hypothetical protein